MRPEFFEYGAFGTLPNPEKLSATHVHLIDIEANDLNDAFQQMQAEKKNWAREGDAHMLVIKNGLDHVSMSVGDVIIDAVGNMHVVGPLGFRTVEGYGR
jgi:hypothetical protein